MFSFLTEVVVTWVVAFVKIHGTVHLNGYSFGGQWNPSTTDKEKPWLLVSFGGAQFANERTPKTWTSDKENIQGFSSHCNVLLVGSKQGSLASLCRPPKPTHTQKDKACFWQECGSTAEVGHRERPSALILALALVPPASEPCAWGPSPHAPPPTVLGKEARGGDLWGWPDPRAHPLCPDSGYWDPSVS